MRDLALFGATVASLAFLLFMTLPSWAQNECWGLDLALTYYAEQEVETFVLEDEAAERYFQSVQGNSTDLPDGSRIFVVKGWDASTGEDLDGYVGYYLHPGSDLLCRRYAKSITQVQHEHAMAASRGMAI